MKVQTCCLLRWWAVWTRSQELSGHQLWSVPGGQPAIGCREKCLRVDLSPPAHSPSARRHSRVHTAHTAELRSTMALVRGLCCRSRFEEDTGNSMSLCDKTRIWKWGLSWEKGRHRHLSPQPANIMWAELKDHCSGSCSERGCVIAHA